MGSTHFHKDHWWAEGLFIKCAIIPEKKLILNFNFMCQLGMDKLETSQPYWEATELLFLYEIYKYYTTLLLNDLNTCL